MIHALDYSSRKRLGCGTAFQIVMQLNSDFPSEELKKNLAEYFAGFPCLTGKVRRDLNLAPYWMQNDPEQAFQLTSCRCSNSAEAYRRLEAELNQPAGKKDCPVRVICVELPRGSMTGFIFDHRLFDARGAEKFLNGFQVFYSTREKALAGLSPSPAHLDRWSEKFAAGKKVNRARIAQVKEAQIKQLKHPAPKKALNRFKTKTFNESETREIFERAGPFMFLPYSLSVSMDVVNTLFLQRGESRGDLAVSVTRDMRPASGGNASEMFFNHLSFMFFRAKNADLENPGLLEKSLKGQFYEQVKEKMPEALAEASMLMRILPLGLMARGLEKRTYAPASFSFASLGESAYQQANFMGAEVERLFHMPRMPLLPGLGIFFSEYKKKLSVTLSFLDQLISEDEAGAILERLGRL